jgi:hypothetical protein
MAALLKCLACAPRPLQWLDDTAYSERLLGAGRIWLDPAALILLRRKEAALLRPDVGILPIEAIDRTWLAGESSLCEALQAKGRAVAPSRTRSTQRKPIPERCTS